MLCRAAASPAQSGVITAANREIIVWAGDLREL